MRRPWNYKDLTNQKFNKLTVIKSTDKRTSSGDAIWLCRCDCGNITYVAGGHLKDGHTKSCGCNKKNNLNGSKNHFYRHGLYGTRLHKIYHNMKTRCFNPNLFEYKNYGKRGIKISEEWLDKENGFINFYTWAIANGYRDDLTLDRIDVNGNYEPSNCRWATQKEQCNNKRTNVIIEYNGERRTIQEWCEKLNIKYSTLYPRLRRGWSIEKAFTTPVDRRKNRWKK